MLGSFSMDRACNEDCDGVEKIPQWCILAVTDGAQGDEWLSRMLRICSVIRGCKGRCEEGRILHEAGDEEGLGTEGWGLRAGESNTFEVFFVDIGKVFPCLVDGREDAVAGEGWKCTIVVCNEV